MAAHFARRGDENNAFCKICRKIMWLRVDEVVS